MLGTKYTILWLLALCGACVAACLTIGTCVLGATPQFFEHWRVPLGKIRGVVASEDAVFVASSTSGRIYKFDFNGRILNRVDIHGRPIWITQTGESITVQYSGREWALDDPAFRVRNPHALVATVEHNCLGHPFLVVRDHQHATRISLQPWYLTVVQSPLPGLLWSPVLLALLFAVGWTWRLGRATRRVGDTFTTKDRSEAP